MEKAHTKDELEPDAPALIPVLARLRRHFAKVRAANYRAKALANLSHAQRRAYQKVFGMLYERSPDKANAKLLVDRILAGISRISKRKSASTPKTVS
jgi:hypothetical protein